MDGVAVDRAVRRTGAYGFAISGVPDVADQLVPAPPSWPDLWLRVERPEPGADDHERMDESRARLRIRSGGSVVIERCPSRATFRLPASPAPAALVHPHLSSVAAVASYWRGRETFHAGGFVVNGRAWGVLGEKTSGKSSMLALLADAGVGIVSDDLLVIECGTAFAGPRSIDLRPAAAAHLGIGRCLGRIGDRERWRVALPQIEPELPLAGWVTLRWGAAPKLRALRGSDRLVELLRHRALRVPPKHGGPALQLSALPLVEFTRPRLWSSAPDALRRLLDHVAG